MSTTESYSARSGNPGLEALVTLLHLQGVAADAGQIRHRLGTDKIPVIQPRVDIRKTLMDKQLGSTLTYFETLQLLVEQQQELSVQKSHLRAAESAAAAIRETSRQAVAEYRHALSDELAKAVQKANGLAQDLIKAEQKTRLQVLTAPVDGVVQQLAVHTVGGVVTPAQALLVVVPRDSRLEIEAMVSNRDIGFVQPGQKACRCPLETVFIEGAVSIDCRPCRDGHIRTTTEIGLPQPRARSAHGGAVGSGMGVSKRGALTGCGEWRHGKKKPRRSRAS